MRFDALDTRGREPAPSRQDSAPGWLSPAVSLTIRAPFVLEIQLTKVLLAFLCLFAGSAIGQDIDRRQTLMLSEGQRAHVLEEMRALLAGTEAILAALAKDDLAAVAQSSSPLGVGMTRKAEDHLRGVLPKEFMQLGMSVHADFDRIAADAQSKKDARRSLRQLSEAMSKSVACHATYQIRMTNPTGPPDARHPSHPH